MGALSAGGGLAAWLVGGLILSGAGWYGGAVLAAFFVSSSLVSRLTSRRSQPRLSDAKGERRDAWQVLANGGAAALAAILARAEPLSIWLVSASLAAAAADTWATSVGLLSGSPPRLLWNNRPVVRGTSGGVTLAGMAGGIVGAAIVALTAGWLTGRPRLAAGAMLVGFAGMLVDSLLGGMLQGRFFCPHCGEESEWRRHRCGRRTQLQGGVAWLNNDAVNGVATALAALAAWALWHWLD